MPLIFGVPVHPSAAHFPIAGAAFGAVALVVAAWLTSRGRAEVSGPWRWAGALLLAVALLGIPVLILSGRAWAVSLDEVVPGSLLPKPDAADGVLYWHAIWAGATFVAAIVAFPLAWAARDPKKPVLAAAVAAVVVATFIGLTGHLGGKMVHKPAGAPAEAPATR